MYSYQLSVALRQRATGRILNWASNDGAFWKLIATALLGHIGHDSLQSLQVDKFLGNLLYVFDCQRMNLRTRVVVSIGQMKEPAQFNEAKAKFSASANEVKASQVN